jgi:hypothetical protein
MIAEDPTPPARDCNQALARLQDHAHAAAEWHAQHAARTGCPPEPRIVDSGQSGAQPRASARGARNGQ